MEAELIDRFGSLPPEVKNLLDIVELKRLCRQAGVERVEAGPKGMVLQFRNNTFRNRPGWCSGWGNGRTAQSACGQTTKWQLCANSPTCSA